MAVRSKSLALGLIVASGTPVAVYQPPTGYRTIVKDVHLKSFSGATVSVFYGVIRGAGTFYLRSYSFPAAIGSDGTQDDIWLVLEDTDQLFVHATAASVVNYSFSGAELPL